MVIIVVLVVVMVVVMVLVVNLTFNLLILKVISCIPPTGTRSLPVVMRRNFFCSISL